MSQTYVSLQHFKIRSVHAVENILCYLSVYNKTKRYKRVKLIQNQIGATSEYITMNVTF